METATNFLWSNRSLRDDVFITPPNFDKEKSPHTYASFGDDGMTVSINAFGNIMQMSRYLGFGCSGFLCVDSAYSKPYWVVDRMEDILKSSKDPYDGFRLDIISSDKIPELSFGFTHDRWPRYVLKNSGPPKLQRAHTSPPAEQNLLPLNKPVISLPGFSYSIQYYCFENTVVQKYQILLGANGIPDEKVNWGKLSLVPPANIRSLNFVENLDFDQRYQWVRTLPVSKRSIMMVHDIPATHFSDEEAAQYLDEERPVEQMQDKDARRSGSPIAAALIISPFINDEPATIVDENCIDLRRIDGKTQLTVTVAYTLKLLDSGFQGLFGVLDPTAEVEDDPETQSIIDAETIQPSASEQMKGSEERDQPAPTASSECMEQPSSARDAISVAEQDAISASADEDERISAAGTKKFTSKEKKIADGWAAEVDNVMQEMSKVFCEEASFRRICFSLNKDLDYAFRRNLEHILSVCSIPIPLKKDEVPIPDQGPVFALTCGDIAGHRIGSRASLAAYQFLCQILPYLDSKNEEQHARHTRLFEKPKFDEPDFVSKEQKNPDVTEVTNVQGMNQTKEAGERKAYFSYLSELYERTRRVLRGHMLWICTKAACTKDGSFHPHYWPDGRPIVNLDFLPAASTIDTPLQFLKVSCYTKLLEGEIWMREKLNPKAQGWLRNLHGINQRGSYAFCNPVAAKDGWQRAEQDHTTKYRLTDHVMIGLALKFIEDFKLLLEHDIRPFYSYRESQKKILKRFTVENPISKQKMLATSRWRDRTRFLLHSKDTFLFSSEGLEYFLNPVPASRKLKQMRDGSVSAKSADPWKYADRRWAKLLDAQAYHDDLQLVEWDNPLWYALVLFLTCKGTRVNNETSDKMIEVSRTVLLGSASYNGLFAGQLGRNSVPEIFSWEPDRDDYWFRTFEIMHILWNTRMTEESETSQDANGLASKKGRSAPMALTVPKETTRIGQQVEKHVTFNNIGPSITQPDLIVLSDDWLQDSPAFLDSSSESKVGSAINTQTWHKILDQVYKGQFSKTAGIVIDVPKWSTGTEISKPQLAPSELAKKLDQQNVWDSKKRIIWLPCYDATIVKKDINMSSCTEQEQESLRSFLGEDLDQTSADNFRDNLRSFLRRSLARASSSVEKESVHTFLTRNFQREKYFLDSANADLNQWETELHLSFFGTSKTKKDSLYKLESQTFLTSITMSLRFLGDYSDRYWVCYFLEPSILECSTGKPQAQSLGERLRPREDCGIKGNLGLTTKYAELSALKRLENRPTTASSWQQRKVLELLIYSKMLEKLRESTNAILIAVRTLALQSNSDGQLNQDFDSFEAAIDQAKRLQQLGEIEDYASIAREWRRFIQVLIIVEENLIDNIEKIDQWEQRETERENQQPRWTERDKQNHFTTILRLKILTQRQVRDIKRLKDNVATFRESLPKQLGSIREDISFRGSQNINLFTYVTVVFLPLGFATGVLSISGLPDHDLLMNLVYMSLVAFGVTIFALINARSVQAVLPMFLKFPQRLLKFMVFERLAKPIIYRREQEKRWEKQGNENDQDSQPESRKTVSKSSPEASIHDLAAKAALTTPRHTPTDPPSDKAHVKILSNKEPQGWREWYQDILHFSFLAEVRKEKRKQSREPLVEATKKRPGSGTFSLDKIIRHRTQKGDEERGVVRDASSKPPGDAVATDNPSGTDKLEHIA